LLKNGEAFAKHKTAGTRNNQPGRTGKSNPITPIMKKIIPIERKINLAVFPFAGSNFIIMILRIQSHSKKIINKIKG
jgi:hypothetical protein